MTGSVVCLGDVMVDVLARLPGPLAIGSDTPAPVALRPGGSAANTACWLSSLGVPVLFVGRVGDDPFGRDAIAALRSAGVRRRVSVDPRAPTGVCIVLIGPDGERTMVPSAGANDTLTPAELAGLVSTADHLHLSGYGLLNPGSRAAARSALAQARSAGASISVDAASAAPIRAVGATAFLGWLPAETLLIANTEELAALTNSGDPAELVDRSLTVVVKDGPAGARIADRHGVRRIPTVPVAVLDSTGAGDAFAAGLLAARRAGADLAAAVSAGNQTAARALGVLGGRPM
ncbi:MAG: carbohydrate kinase family protein [Jatrophihabitantaceae bacterium]